MKKVYVTLSNRFAELHPPYPQDELMSYYSFHPSGYRFMPAFRMGRWDGRVRLLKRNFVPTGLFLATWEQIQQDLDIRFRIDKKDFFQIDFKSNGVTSNREYQNECVDRMVAAARHHGGGLVLAATGAGKTRTAGQFFSRLVGAGCFIVDELTLLKQARQELEDILKEKVGEVGDSRFEPKRITVATSQTLHLHCEDKKFEEWTDNLMVNIIDEVHVAMSRRNFAIVEAIAPPAVFGLTATLELQKKDVRVRAYALTGPVCYEYPLEQGQEEGYLAKGVVVQIFRPHYDDSKNGYAADYRDLIVDNSNRNHFIRSLVREAVRREKFPIVLVERIRHLKLLSELLRNIPHRVVCGEKLVEQRLLAMRKFEAGEVKLLLANKVFQKGINIKKLDVIIDAGAMKSKNRAVQIFGRGIRQVKGKTGLLYFDVGDTKNRFEKATRMRRSALKKHGIPIKKGEFAGKSAYDLFEIAEKMLATEGENAL